VAAALLSVAEDGVDFEDLAQQARPGPSAVLRERGLLVAQVRWYNTEHLHSALRFVTPADRHAGRDEQILDARREVYERARRRRPERWAKDVRNWAPLGDVTLNPAVERARVARTA